MRDVSGARCQNKQGLHVEGVCVCVCVCVGRINLACMWIWEVFRFELWGNIFCLSDVAPVNRGVSPSNWFCSSNKLEILQRRWCSWWVLESLYCKRVCVCVCVRDRAPSSENQQKEKKKPVINHVNAGWQANTRINGGTYNNNAWKMEQSLSLSFFFFSTVLPTKPRLFITLGRCLVASRCMSALGP